MICFTPESAPRNWSRRCTAGVEHFLHCGTIWVHGPTTVVPTTEEQPRRPFGDYGVQQAAIERLPAATGARPASPPRAASRAHRRTRLAADQSGRKLRPRVLPRWRRGDDVDAAELRPGDGASRARRRRGAGVHARGPATAARRSARVPRGRPAGLTLRGYAEAVAGWFGREAQLEYLPWEQFRRPHRAKHREATWDHIAHSPYVSIDKARRATGLRASLHLTAGGRRGAGLAAAQRHGGPGERAATALTCRSFRRQRSCSS